MTWDELVERLTKTEVSKDKVGSFLDPPAGAFARCQDVDWEDATDDKARTSCLIFDPAATPHKSVWLVFSVSADGHLQNERDDSLFRISLGGRVEKAIFGRMKMDTEGNEIAGSGVLEVQNIDSPRIKELFQKEVDFWLKGMYRKKPAAKPASDKEALAPK